MKTTKYKGIKKGLFGKGGNINTIWTKGDDGLYHCPITGLKLTEADIQKDLKNGYLQELPKDYEILDLGTRKESTKEKKLY